MSAIPKTSSRPIAPPSASSSSHSTNGDLLGQRAEDYAAAYLERAGLRCIARNCHVGGSEIDLIMQAGDDRRSTTIVFVEVRSRSSARHGPASATIGCDKRRFLSRGAKAWLVRQNLWNKVACRFDVVAMHWPLGASAPTSIEWIANAFESEEGSYNAKWPRRSGAI